MAGIFKATLSLCGLTLQRASEYLDVRRDTVVSWSADRSSPPEGIWIQLADLYAEVNKAGFDRNPQIDLNATKPRQWGELVSELETSLPPGPEANARAVALLKIIQNRADRSHPGVSSNKEAS